MRVLSTTFSRRQELLLGYSICQSVIARSTLTRPKVFHLQVSQQKETASSTPAMRVDGLDPRWKRPQARTDLHASTKAERRGGDKVRWCCRSTPPLRSLKRLPRHRRIKMASLHLPCKAPASICKAIQSGRPPQATSNALDLAHISFQPTEKEAVFNCTALFYGVSRWRTLEQSASRPGRAVIPKSPCPLHISSTFPDSLHASLASISMSSNITVVVQASIRIRQQPASWNLPGTSESKLLEDCRAGLAMPSPKSDEWTAFLPDSCNLVVESDLLSTLFSNA